MFILQDVFPMIRELQFDAKFRRVMLTVFGKTLMCRDIDVASQYSKSANMDCVTMEGMLCRDAFLTRTLTCCIRAMLNPNILRAHQQQRQLKTSPIVSA